MYVTINYNMYTICIRNMARSKSIPLLCTHVGSYKFSTVHPPGNSMIIKLLLDTLLPCIGDLLSTRVLMPISTSHFFTDS
jgi:hypothetical protein